MLTQERLKQLLHYDPDTGVFTWIVSKKGVTLGTRAGHLGQAGYRSIKIDQIHYLEHRLAWLYCTGSEPALNIDHIDRVRDNNRFVNLREATVKQNTENSKLPVTNKSGFRGVIKRNISKYPLKPFVAQISHNRRPIHIGNFATPEEASEAYESLRDKLFTHHKQAA